MYKNEQYKRVQQINMYEQKKRHSRVYKENSRGIQGAWKDEALDGRLEIHATAAPL